MILDIDTDLQQRVSALANAQQRETSWLVLDALREYVDREERLKSHWERALQSWDDYQQNGLHVTHEEMETWFDQIENGQTDALPRACHK